MSQTGEQLTLVPPLALTRLAWGPSTEFSQCTLDFVLPPLAPSLALGVGYTRVSSSSGITTQWPLCARLARGWPFWGFLVALKWAREWPLADGEVGHPGRRPVSPGS